MEQINGSPFSERLIHIRSLILLRRTQSGIGTEPTSRHVREVVAIG